MEMTLNTVLSFKFFRNVFFSVALLALMVACNDDDFVQEPIDLAYVAIYHALPTETVVDIVVDGRQINTTPFSYGDWSGYLNFMTGNRNILFRQSGGSALIDTTFNLVTNKAYSLFAIGGIKGPEALLVLDSAGSPTPGNAMVRFVHLSPDAPAVDVSVDEAANLLTDGVFKSASAFKEVEAGDLTVTVSVDGESVATKDVTLRDGQFYTIVLQGYLSPSSDDMRELEIAVLS